MNAQGILNELYPKARRDRFRYLAEITYDLTSSFETESIEVMNEMMARLEFGFAKGTIVDAMCLLRSFNTLKYALIEWNRLLERALASPEALSEPSTLFGGLKPITFNPEQAKSIIKRWSSIPKGTLMLGIWE